MSFSKCEFCGAPAKGYSELREEMEEMAFENSKEMQRLKDKLKDWEQWSERAQGREKQLKDKVKSRHHAVWAWWWFIIACICFIGWIA